MDLRISKTTGKGLLPALDLLQPRDRPRRCAVAYIQGLHRPPPEAQSQYRSSDHFPALLLVQPGWQAVFGAGQHILLHDRPGQPGAQQPVHGNI